MPPRSFVGYPAVGHGARTMLVGAPRRRFAVGSSGRYALIGQDGGRQSAPAGYNPTVYDVQDSNANAARRLIMSFLSDGIVAGARLTVTASPQTIFRPERLIVPAAIAPFFAIENILIGNRSQSASTGEANAAVYSEVSIGTGLLLDTAQPGVTVSLIIRNISLATRNFRATMLGAAVVGSP